MEPLVVGIANCLIGGVEITRYQNGWARDRIDIVLSRTPLTIRQKMEALPGKHSDFSGQAAHTTDIEFHHCVEAKVKAAERIADDVCWLLALATGSPVQPFSYFRGRYGRSQNVTYSAQVFRPLITPTDGEAIRHFLTSTWPAFRKLKRSRRLPAIIDYLVLADRPRQPSEISTLLAFTALESLKSTHSRGQRGEFEARVRRMLEAVGMQRGLCHLVTLRNKIVHEGLAGMPHNKVRRHYDRLQDILREYLLRLLGYHGSYLLYSSAARQSRVLR